MGLDYKGLISIHGVFKLSELVTFSSCLSCDHTLPRSWSWSPSWWRGWAGRPRPSPSGPGTPSGWGSWPPGPGWSSPPPSSPAFSLTRPWPGHWWATFMTRRRLRKKNIACACDSQAVIRSWLCQFWREFCHNLHISHPAALRTVCSAWWALFSTSPRARWHSTIGALGLTTPGQTPGTRASH